MATFVAPSQSSPPYGGQGLPPRSRCTGSTRNNTEASVSKLLYLTELDLYSISLAYVISHGFHRHERNMMRERAHPRDCLQLTFDIDHGYQAFNQKNR